MVYLLTEVLEPNCMNLSVYAKVYDDAEEVMVICKVNKIEMYGIEQGMLRLVDSLFVDEKILVINKFRHINMSNDCLVLLTEANSLLVVAFDHSLGRFNVIESIMFDGSDQQLPSDSLPKIVVDPEEYAKFFVVYFFEGFVQLVRINNDWTFNDVSESNKRSKRKLNQQHDLLDTVSFTVGAIIVQDIQILHTPNNDKDIIAIYYRDFNVNISMRYYEIDVANNKFILNHQFEEFDDIPNTIITPLFGGIIALTDNYIFYFPNPSITSLDIPDDNKDSNLSVNNHNLVITKRLISKNIHEFSAFNQVVVIDDKRILLINNRGETRILFINYNFRSSSSLEICSLSFIDLGKTTVPNSLHHLTENLFFASSKLSQSVLFRILPHEPFIDICQFMPSTPAVLDLQCDYNRDGFLEILSCNGGYESGEYRKFSNKTCFLNIKIRFQSPVDASRTIVTGINDNELVSFQVYDNNDTKGCSFVVDCSSWSHKVENSFGKDDVLISGIKYGDKSIQIKIDGVYVNNSLINKLTIKRAKAINNESYVILDEFNNLYLYDDVLLHTIKLESKSEVSDLDFSRISSQEYLILVSFWDGSYCIYQVSNNDYNLLTSENLLPSGVSISSCCMVYDPELHESSVWLFFMSSNTDLVQIFFDFELITQDVNRINITHLNGLPLKFIKNDQGDVILFNKKDIFGLYNEKSINYNKVFCLSTPELSFSINDICFIESNHIIITANRNDILICSIEPKSFTDDVIFSNDFNIRSLKLPRSKYSVVVSSKSAFMDSSNDYCRNTFLKLVDTNTMEIVHKLEYPDDDPVDIVDICPLQELEFLEVPKNCFIAVCNSDDTNKIIRLFYIKKNKIIDLPLVKVLGLSDTSKLTNQSIKLLNKKDNAFLINGVANFIIKPKSLNEWIVQPKSVNVSSVFTMSGSICGNKIVFGDVMKGLSVVKWTKDSHTDEYEVSNDSKDSTVKTNFITDVKLFKDHNDEHITLVTDTFGNIVASKITGHGDDTKEEEEEEEVQNQSPEVISYNIGDSINTLITIPKPNVQLDFNSQFDKIDQPEPITIAKILIGTVNGGIYSISDLIDVDEDIQHILETCYKELVLFKHTLSDMQMSNKRDKFNRWITKRQRKFLQQDSDGQFLTKPSFGIIDMTLIQKWLQRDYILQRVDSRTEDSEQELKEMHVSLKSCYTHKNLLCKIIHETQLL